MIENVIARRYAKALAEVAAEKGELDRTSADLNLLAGLIDRWRKDFVKHDLADVLASPTISLQEKERICEVVCKKLEMSPLLVDFIDVLVAHDRVRLIGRIARAFGRMTERLETVSTADVDTAHPLTADEQAVLSKKLVQIAGRPVRMVVRENSKLLAGVRVRVNGVLYDGTLRGRLDRMARQVR